MWKAMQEPGMENNLKEKGLWCRYKLKDIITAEQNISEV